MQKRYLHSLEGKRACLVELGVAVGVLAEAGPVHIVLVARATSSHYFRSVDIYVGAPSAVRRIVKDATVEHEGILPWSK